MFIDLLESNLSPHSEKSIFFLNLYIKVLLKHV